LAHRALFNAGAEQGSATAQREALKTCPYFNALQVKYAYAVTCHKAQGGQWTSVFVDMGYIPPEAYRTPDFYRWLYTSITRATTSLHLLNPSCLIR
jgi:exodeoxyribonuclease-5